MLKDWAAERYSLAFHEGHKVKDLRKRLARLWSRIGLSEEQIESVKKMKKREVISELYKYCHVMEIGDREKNRIINPKREEYNVYHLYVKKWSPKR